jgi:glutathione S-transferase
LISLYSFRRCPYAIRARWALELCEITFTVIEVDLKNKPEHLLNISPKGTVPVLYDQGLLLEESIDIVKWAFALSCPKGWQAVDHVLANDLIARLMESFVLSLNRFKYAARYEDVDIGYEQSVMESYLKTLAPKEGVMGPKSWVDCVILPLIRQAYLAHDTWHESWPHPVLEWYQEMTGSPEFVAIMQKTYKGYNVSIS